MQPWVVEYGTLWALEMGGRLPPICPARTVVEFAEIGDADHADLAQAMGLAGSALIQERRRGRRRCFCLRANGRIACYGWVTQGVEHVGELERYFNLRDDEAYIWDCATVPAWRGQRLYSALLSQIVYQLQHEGVRRTWIGASRLNQPSIQGFANAGFKPVIDCTYRRILRLTLLLLRDTASAQESLRRAALRIIINEHERRLGPVALGYLPAN